MRSLKSLIVEEVGAENFLGKDLIAGLTVALVALPLAIAFGVSSGMGAAAGLVSAIVAGFIAALAGGSRYQVSGPTGAMTVVLLPIVQRVGITAVFAAGLLAGLLLVLAGYLGLGSHIHRLPMSLIEGFTAGIAVVIALQQVPLVWGATGEHTHVLPAALSSLTHAANVQSGNAIAALATAAFLISVRHRWVAVPKSLLAILVVTILNAALKLDLPTVGALPSQMFHVSLNFLNDLSTFAVIAPPAVSIAVLAALESLLSAKIADRLAHTQTVHDSDRELVGQGIANVLTPLFGGVPATAALARTAVNVQAGAQTRVAAMTHSVVLAVAVLVFGPYVSAVPIAALAGVLWATTANMIKLKELRAEMRISHLDALILIVTFVLTITVDLIVAVAAGTGLWLVLRNRLTSGREPVIDETETLGD